MLRITTTLALLGLCALPGPALAGPHCSVPLAEWQPREALEARLKSEGWVISRLKTDDGCYKVYATGPEGKRLKAKFNPATLERLPRESD
jgi:hypothetical protein